MFSGLSLSEFEIFMIGYQGEPKKWNMFLPHFVIVFFILTALFIAICQIIIKVYFKIHEPVGMQLQKYKTVLSFKVLRIILGLFFFLPFWVAPSLFVIGDPSPSKLRFIALPLPFFIAIIGNIILLVYVVGNREACEYLIAKIKSFREGQVFKREIERSRMQHKSNKVRSVPFGQENMREGREFTRLAIPGPVEEKKRSREKFQNVYVIDLERNYQESSL